ncbi:hypothetical protein [Corynebacterium frankenforstense]
MSDKDSQEGKQQLTVAELLARSGDGSGSGSSSRRRRHRRSLEEGGISVAELTGNMPRVREKPAESRHSSVPIDAPAEPARKASDDAEKKAAERAEAEKKAAEKTKAQKAEADKKAADKAAAEKRAAEQAKAEKAKAEKAAAEKQASDSVKLTKPEKDKKTSDAATGTGTASAAKATGAAGSAAATVAPSDSETGELARVEDTSDHTTEVEAVRDDADARTDGPTDDLDAADYEDADYGYDEETSGGIGSVIILAVLGIVVGAIVFLGFQQLWESGLSRILVAVLALAVTAVLVGVVHALRTARDGLSMGLAAVVGLLMTFGPYLPMIL